MQFYPRTKGGTSVSSHTVMWHICLSCCICFIACVLTLIYHGKLTRSITNLELNNTFSYIVVSYHTDFKIYYNCSFIWIYHNCHVNDITFIRKSEYLNFMSNNNSKEFSTMARTYLREKVNYSVTILYFCLDLHMWQLARRTDYSFTGTKDITFSSS